jgi:hypothetical protein
MIAQSWRLLIMVIPFSIQGMTILIDEFVYHRNRRLPRWERVGHPIDTFLQLVCLAIPLTFEWSQKSIVFYSAIALVSTLLITKDEHVHALHCSWQEHWLHAILFIVHPVVLIATAYLWSVSSDSTWFYPLLKFQIGLMAIFGVYQITYWSFYGAKA